MKIIVDMNLSPDWVEVLEQAGWDTIPWSMVGDMCATDEVIKSWVHQNGYIVFTHDLDFGILLALTQAESPSVIQIRAQDVLPKVLGSRMVKVLKNHQSLIEKGALLTVDERKARVRILPFS